MATTVQSDNSGVGVVVGILLALVIGVGAYYFLANNHKMPSKEVNITMPDVKVEAPSIAPKADVK